MILGHLHHQSHILPIEIQRAVEHLRSTDYQHKAPGKYEIDNTRMFALVQDPLTQDWGAGAPEFHHRHIDVQYLMEGEELIAYLPTNKDLKPTQNHLAERDIAFVAPQPYESKLLLTPGMFAVFYPGELHRPCRSVNESMRIKKVVIKIDTGIVDKDT